MAASSSSKNDTSVKALVIGDPHFKAKNIREGEEFSQKAIEAAETHSPDFIVVLGDTLDTHEVVRVTPHNLACNFIESLSNIAPVFLLIGNHDLINQCQFLTSNHIFNPLKKWKNVTVVDKPVIEFVGELCFIFCPYVPPGKFKEALDEIVKQGEMWDFADCIFAHQEFRGCQMGDHSSVIGDKWDEDYPPVISGHIHNSQTVGKNVFYPGSSIQHAFGESPDKCLWSVTFGKNDEPPYFDVEKIDLGLKNKKIIYLNIDDIDTFDRGQIEKYQIKLSLKGSPEQFRVFRRGKTRTDLLKLGVKFAYTPILSDHESGEKKTREQTSFLGVLKEVIEKKSKAVKEVYQDIIGDSSNDDADWAALRAGLQFHKAAIAASSEGVNIIFDSSSEEIILTGEEDDEFSDLPSDFSGEDFDEAWDTGDESP